MNALTLCVDIDLTPGPARSMDPSDARSQRTANSKQDSGRQISLTIEIRVNYRNPVTGDIRDKKHLGAPGVSRFMR